MAEYYAIERSPEYLMHYGVKGMRWGVRKAIERGSDKKLWRQYSKAQKKLNKLNRKADPAVQKRKEIDYEVKAKGYKTVGRVGLGISGLGLGAGFGYMPIHNKKYKNLERQAKIAIEQNNLGIISDQGLNNRLNGIFDNQANLVKKQERFNRRMGAVAATGAGMAIAGYGGYGINKLKAYNTRKRQSVEGHKAAVAKRDAWQKEMKSAFKGTKYANSMNPQDYGKEYYKRNKAKIDKRLARWDAYDKKTNYRRFRQKYD